MPSPSLLATKRLARPLLCAAALLALATGAQAATCRVSPTGAAANDGSTWALATTLREAIDRHTCNEIWVQRGSYTPSTEYIINRNLFLRGDFVGNEATAGARTLPLDPSRTTLNAGDNSRILYIDGTTSWGSITRAGTLIEAFTLRGGNGQGMVASGRGGAAYCRSMGTGECSPSFRQMVFRDNNAGFGGAIFHDAIDGGTSSPSYTDVTFANNEAAHGGAINMQSGNSGKSLPAFFNVTFSGNKATASGGAVWSLSDWGGESRPGFNNVTFSGNHAGDDGGAIFSASGPLGNSASAFYHATFVGNDAFRGGAIFNESPAGHTIHPMLANSVLWGNTAQDSGAQIFNTLDARTVLWDSIVQGGCGNSGTTGILCDTFSNGSAASDPLLGPLQGNGGPTHTHLPGTGSAAIDSADTDNCLPTDQRGISRPRGTGCDIGAVEVQTTYIITPDTDANGAISPVTPQITAPGATQTFTLTIPAGWVIDQVTGCGGTLVGNTYTTAPATADCTVLATFRLAGTTPPGAVTPVPTLGAWGVPLLGLLAAGLGARALRRRGGRQL